MASLENVVNKSESITNGLLKLEIQKALSSNCELGARRLQEVVESNNPNWKLNPQRFRKLLRDVRGNKPQEKTARVESGEAADSSNSVEIEETADRRNDIEKNKNGKGKGKGNKKRSDVEPTEASSSGDSSGGGVVSFSSDAAVAKGAKGGKGGKGKQSSQGNDRVAMETATGGGGGGGGGGKGTKRGKGSKKHKEGSKDAAATKDGEARVGEIVMNEEHGHTLIGLTAVEAGGLFPEDIVTLIRKNGRTRKNGVRFIGFVDRVGGYVGDNEYEEEDDEEPLAVGKATVSWIYPNSCEATVDVNQLLILDRSFAFGGSVALAKDPLNTLGFVMHNDSKYDVRPLGTITMVRNLSVDDLKPVGEVVIGQWVVHPRSQWFGLIMETEVSVIVDLDDGMGQLEVTYNTEEDEENPLPEYGQSLQYAVDADEEHFPTQRVSVSGDSWLRAKLISNDASTSQAENQKAFNKLKKKRRIGTVVNVITRRVKVCWKASTISNNEFGEQTVASFDTIPERLALACRAPPRPWIDYEELVSKDKAVVRDPRDIWHVGDILLYQGKPVQVSNIHTKAMVHWADGSVSTDPINALQLVPKVFMNDHDVMIFDMVSKSNAIKIDENEGSSSLDEVGVVVKCDNVNCVAEVNWLKSNLVEKVSTFDLRNHDITLLGEFVIRKTPEHKLLGHSDGLFDSNYSTPNTRAYESCLIYMDAECNPIGSFQKFAPHVEEHQLIVALSDEMQELSHVTQHSLFHSDKLTHDSLDIQVGGIVGLDTKRPNMVQVLWHDKSLEWVSMHEVAIVVGNAQDEDDEDGSTFTDDDDDHNDDESDEAYSSEEGGEEYGGFGDVLATPQSSHSVVMVDSSNQGLYNVVEVRLNQNQHESDGEESDGFETESDSEDEGKGGEIGDIGVVVQATANLCLDTVLESKTDESTQQAPLPSDTLHNGGASSSGGGGGGDDEDDDDEDDDSFFSSLPHAPSDHKFIDSVENVSAKVARKEFTILRRAGGSSSGAGGGGGDGGGKLEMVVRCFEDRMDLLRVLIIGPRDTPYEHVPFFFDVQLPAAYPQEPPKVHYVSTSSERLNPNLYDDGKVCLSLLGTWSGPGWNPSKSTLLQVLISIQGLILVEHPFYNEPGFEKQSETSEGAENARRYNEKAKLLSLRSTYMLFRSPPLLFHRHLQRHFIELSAGKKLIEQVENLVSILEQDDIIKVTMAERALQLAPPPASRSEHTVGNTERQQGAAAEDSSEEASSTLVDNQPKSMKKEVKPSTGFLLALKKMLPTLQELFQIVKK